MVKEILKKLNFQEMSLIQKRVYSEFKRGQNLIIVSPTGTGKTHSYLIPIYESFEKAFKEGLKLVIIVPTNELVFQVYNMTKQLFDNYKIRTFYGSMDRNREIEWLERNQVDIAIGTPSKIAEFVKLGYLSFANLQYLIFDEADMMFEIDFINQIVPILKTSKLGHLILVSATITQAMKPFINDFFGNSKLIDVTKEEKLDIKYFLLKTGIDNRLDILHRLINVINPFLALIFVSKKENQEVVYKSLLEKKLNVANLSGDMNVKIRRQIIKDVQNLKYQYLVTSDIASRGIDFVASHIINYDLPYHLEYFTHRSGRTGRMGSSGIVYTLQGDKDHRSISNLSKKGFIFQEIKIRKDEIIYITPKADLIKAEEMAIIKKIKKPREVKPNYRKKNKQKIEKELKEFRRKRNVKNRKPR